MGTIFFCFMAKLVAFHFCKTGSPVGLGEVSSHFWYYVCSLSLRFCKWLLVIFPGLEPMTAWSEGNSFTLLPFNFCFFWRTKSLNMKVNTMADCKLFSLQLQSFETELLVPKLAEKEGGSDICRGVFIRAPAILEVGPDVEILADCPVPSDRPSITITSAEGAEVCI
jgi:hypothetical protein